MRRHRRIVAAIAGAALLIPAAAACGSDDSSADESSGNGAGSDSGGEDAGESGGETLTIYSGRNEELIDPLIGQLEEATGVEVTVRYAGTAEHAAALMEEGENTGAGLFISQDAGALGALSKAGLLEELPEDVLGGVDEAHRGSAGDWVGISGRARVLVYNQDLVEEGDLPGSIHDLTDEEWNGKVAYAPTNASFQTFVTALRVLEGEDGARDWLEALQANDAEAFDGNGGILDAVNNGDIEVGLVNHYYWYATVAEEGEDSLNTRLHYFPGGDPGSLINVAGVGITAHGGQSDAALKAVEYLLSEEAQLYFAEETKEYPLAAGVTSPVEELPAFDSIEAPDVNLTDLDSLEETLALLQEVGMV
ncbi:MULTISPECIES: iron ABC transporter substrate-binding protein [Streptomyces]|uniref:iron ABC transporter substrate-binding protein n=1 Tax=Streptomyces TaxID=1883 RepID=UPI000CD4E09B|nr:MULTISPECIES: iron ABC transporter substrate-binding protein [Streptomyces]